VFFEEKTVVTLCVTIIGILIVLYMLPGLVLESRFYTASFENKPSYSIENVSLGVQNGGSGADSLLNIYGVRNQTVLSSSQLTKDGEQATGTLSFNNHEKITLNVTNNKIDLVRISFNNFGEGQYRGWIFLTEKSNLSVPFLVSTEPKVIHAFILVIIGVLSAIAMWELFFYIDERYNVRTRDQNRNKANNAALSADSRAIHNQIAQRKEERIQRIQSRYLARGAQIVSLDVVAVILAIVGGLVALTNTDYLSSLVEINWYDAFVLIVTGIGIGNLKAVVDN
jgi:hypothetical protein